jgi:hypothetical protein
MGFDEYQSLDQVLESALVVSWADLISPSPPQPES